MRGGGGDSGDCSLVRSMSAGEESPQRDRPESLPVASGVAEPGSDAGSAACGVEVCRTAPKYLGGCAGAAPESMVQVRSG